MINPEIFKLSLHEEIMKDRAKGLTKYYSAKRLKLPIGIVARILEEEIKKDRFQPWTAKIEAGLNISPCEECAWLQ